MSRMNVRLSTREWTPGLVAAGTLLVALGAWGVVVALAGPLFDFGFDTRTAWQGSERHWTLSLGPGMALAVAGLAMVSGDVTRARAGALLALVVGVWFVTGPYLHGIWGTQTQPLTTAAWKQALLWVGWYLGVGAAGCSLAAYALGLLSRRQLTGTVALIPPPSADVADAPAPEHPDHGSVGTVPL